MLQKNSQDVKIMVHKIPPEGFTYLATGLKVDKMCVSISFTLEASEIFFYLYMFRQERAVVVLASLVRISYSDPSLEMLDPRYLKFSTASVI